MEKYIINGRKVLSGSVKISGAKNSALKIIAASILSEKQITLRNVPDIEDVKTMVEVLKTLNAEVFFNPNSNILKIDCSKIDSFEAPYELVRKMRASVLVAGPLLSRFGIVKVAIPGGCNIGARQIDLHLKGFEQLGATNKVEHGYIISKSKSKSAVFAGRSMGKAYLKGTIINLDFPSRGATENLMMAAVLAQGETIINNAAREAEIVDLANFLNSMGAEIKGAGTDCIKINGVKSLAGTDYTIMPDSIEAGTFITAASLCGDKVKILDAVWDNLEIFCLKLKDIGIEIESVNCVESYKSADYASEKYSSVNQKNGSKDINTLGNIKTKNAKAVNTIFVKNSLLSASPKKQFNSVYISTLPYPGFPTDLQPIIAVLLSVIPGVSIITENVFENRFMYADELNRMGANIKVDGHHAVITGVKKLSGAPVKAFDLRAGAAMVLAGLIAEGTTEVYDIYHIKRGYERFEQKLSALGADIKLSN